MRSRGRCTAPWRIAAAAVCAVLASAGSASAHDLWLEPPPATAAGALVSVDARVGHAGHGETVRRDASRIVRLQAYGPSAVVDLPGLDGRAPLGVLRPAADGAWVVAYETHPFAHTLPAARFATYLDEEGLDTVARARRAAGTADTPGRELVSRAVKTLLVVGDAVPADRRVGLPVEIVAERLPPRGAPGDLVLRLEVAGVRRAGVLVDLRSLDLPSTDSAGALADRVARDGVDRDRVDRTDADGRVRFTIGPGRWLAAAVHSRPADAADASGAGGEVWRTIFASWTVDLGGERGPAP